MSPTTPAQFLQIHISERDAYQGKPLYEAIVTLCREMRIAGATVFRGLEGYGETAELHKAHLGRHDSPIVIAIVDHREKIAALITKVEEMLDTGLLAVSNVEVIRITGEG